MKVMKFGGTSVGRPERMKQVASLVTQQEVPVLVVLSALAGTTNSLVEIGNFLAAGKKQEAAQVIDQLEKHYQSFVAQLVVGNEASQEAVQLLEEHFGFLRIIQRISFSEALRRDILAQGELLSTKLFSVYCKENNWSHALLPALDFMILDEQDEPALSVIGARLKALLQANADKKLFITQGYICRNSRGEVDNLKRGGSDYTASLVAAAAGASVCEIWTDIDGMHNNDPRIVAKTFPIEQLSFDEAAELAYFGAKILHPASIWPAQQFQVPVRLLNTMETAAKGTLISATPAAAGVKAVAAKDNIIAIRIKSSRMLLAYGFLRKIFEVFEKYKTPIDMITTSEVAVSLTIDTDQQLHAIMDELSRFGHVEVDKEQTIVSLVGFEITSTPAILSNLSLAVKDIPVRMISYGGSPHNISLLVPATAKTMLLQQLNKEIFGLN
ncbi:MAG: aspartate kinase [Bacteroidetes bacterium]|nr:aspartate kinase [Bacteroidota bacterium]